MGRQWYDSAPQMQMIVNELSGNYRDSTYRRLQSAKTPEDAAAIILRYYEGNQSDKITDRQTAAKKWARILEKNGFPSASGNDGDNSSGQCDTSDDESNASYGSVGGAPIEP